VEKEMKHKTMPLGSIAIITSGGTPDRKNSEYWNGDIPWVKTAQIQNKVITGADIDEWITAKGLSESSAKMIPRGTILMAMYGQGKTRGQVAVLGIDAAINQACAAILLKDGVDRDYVFQQLRYRYDAIRALSNMGSQENLNADLIREIAFPIPLLDDQRRIAGLLKDWDTAIETTERLIAAKERHYTHELSRLISRGQHPRTNVGTFACEVRERNACRSVALAEIATIWKGQQLNRDAMVEDGPYYVLNGGTKPSGRTTDWNCEANTITISEGGNSCGFVSYNSERFWCGGHCYALKDVAEIVNVHYLFHYLKGMQERIMALRVGSGLPNIQKSDLETFPVILPDLSTQSTIARYLNALREEIDLLEKSRDALKRQKRGLMQKLLTGEWRVPPSNAESTDKEPAPC
jgi:type I restriction enzyme S subunit